MRHFGIVLLLQTVMLYVLARHAEREGLFGDDQFRRAIVFLRRAFGGFTPHQKRQICENLAEHWGVNAEQASEVLSAELTETEQKKLGELSEFNFDDI